MNEAKRILWEKRFAEYEQSGQSGAQWCREHEYGYDSFRYWRVRIRANRNQDIAALSLPIEAIPNAGWTGFLYMAEDGMACEAASMVAYEADNSITITFGTAAIKLSRGFDKELLKEIAEVLS